MSVMRTSREFQCGYTWTIRPFEPPYGGFKRPTEFVIKSPHFSAASSNFEFDLEFHIAYEKYNPQRSTTLYLEVSNKAALQQCGPVKGKFECSLINSEGQKLTQDAREFRFDSKKYFIYVEKFPSDMPSLLATKCVYGNQLSIYCQVTYTEGPENTVIINRPDPFLENIDEFLNNEQFSDVTVYVGDRKFPCHRIVLAAKSLVFKAMLTHNMKESNTNRIDIRDVDENVFEAMLRFIYTGKIESLETMALELLHAADKYDLASLKTICENELCKSLNAENAVKMLSISTTYNLDKLKLQTTDFIRMNLKYMAGTESWNVLKSQPDLMHLILEAFAK